MTERTPTGIYFETKKQPFDIRIDNNKKEPKLSKNMRFSDKQNYYRYKTLTEPKLLNRMMVDANDSESLKMISKIQEILGVAPKKESEAIITAPSGYIAPPTAASAEESEDVPDTRYTFEGDMGRISTGLLEGISAISDISVEDGIKLTGLIPDDKSVAGSEDRDSIKSFEEENDLGELERMAATMTPLDLLKYPQGRELINSGLYEFTDIPVETKLKIIREKSAARTIENAFIRKLDKKIESSTAASGAPTVEVEGETPVARRTRSRKVKGRVLDLTII